MQNIIIDKNPHPADYEQIEQRLNEYNQWQTGCQEEALRIIVKNDSGDIIGGIIGTANFGCLEIDLLWCAAETRGQGVGTMLMKEAEKFAREYQLELMQLYTWSFQAEKFYRKLGFNECARISGYNNGIAKIFLSKPVEKLSDN